MSGNLWRRAWKWLTAPAPKQLTCREGGDHDYETITLGGYNAPSIDFLSCVWCGGTPDEHPSPPKLWPNRDWEHHDMCDANGCRHGCCGCLGEPYCTPPEKETT